MISVILSTYNESLFEVKRCIDSILEQTYQDIEVIIICDNPDNIPITNYLHTIIDNRVRVYYNEKNQGLVYCLNYALSLANGDYIARMDADDISIKDRFCKQLDYLLDNNLDIIGSWTKLINEEGNEIGDAIFPTTYQTIKRQIKHFNCLAHPTWFGKKKVFDDAAGYRNIKYCEDYDFILRILLKGYKVGNIPEYCLYYQIRATSITRGNLAEQKIRTRYLAKLKPGELNDLTAINSYFQSQEYKQSVNDYKNYNNILMLIRQGKLRFVFTLVFNKNTYYALVDKVRLKSVYQKELKNRSLKK